MKRRRKLKKIDLVNFNSHRMNDHENLEMTEERHRRCACENLDYSRSESIGLKKLFLGWRCKGHTNPRLTGSCRSSRECREPYYLWQSHRSRGERHHRDCLPARSIGSRRTPSGRPPMFVSIRSRRTSPASIRRKSLGGPLPLLSIRDGSRRMASEWLPPLLSIPRRSGRWR